MKDRHGVISFLTGSLRWWVVTGRRTCHDSCFTSVCILSNSSSETSQRLRCSWCVTGVLTSHKNRSVLTGSVAHLFSFLKNLFFLEKKKFQVCDRSRELDITEQSLRDVFNDVSKYNTSFKTSTL
jgi:hypothetical protein